MTQYRVSYEIVNTTANYAPATTIVTLTEGYSDWSDIPNIVALARGVKAENVKILRLVIVEG